MANNHTRSGAMMFLVAILAIMLVIPQVGHATSDEEAFTEIDSYIAEQMDDSRIPGVALSVIEEGQVVHSNGYGHTSDDDETVSPDTLFGIGSTGKSITALGVMQLAEAGQVDLDAPVRDYIPWFALADAEMTSRLTVRHLLNMTSGIPATAGGEAFRSTESMTPEAAIRTLQSAEFSYEPGSTFEYVNANYVILGHLIEVVSGQPYAGYVQEHIFEPLEMHNTYTDLDVARQMGFDAGHRYWFGWPVAHEMDDLPALVPAGYIISNAADLSNYVTMYLNEGTFNGHKLLSPVGIAEMHNGVAEAALGPWADGATAQYGMGWYVGGPWNDGPVVFHPGSEPTFTAMLMVDHDRQLGVVMLMNSAIENPLPGAAGAMRVLPSGVMSILTGSAPGEVGLGRFYFVLDLFVIAIVVAQLAALIRLGMRMVRDSDTRVSGRSTLAHARRTLPLLWEFGLPLGILVLPGVLGMSWQSLMLWMPDLGVVFIAMAVIWFVTGVVRVALLLRHRFPQSEQLFEARPSGGEIQSAAGTQP
jgi:CubicO group peptidase (beta-lactamase class C family)